MKSPKDEPVVAGGAASIGIVSMLYGVSQMLGLDLTEVQLLGMVSTVIAIVTWLQRRKSSPSAKVDEALKMVAAAEKATKKN